MNTNNMNLATKVIHAGAEPDPHGSRSSFSMNPGGPATAGRFGGIEAQVRSGDPGILWQDQVRPSFPARELPAWIRVNS